MLGMARHRSRRHGVSAPWTEACTALGRPAPVGGADPRSRPVPGLCTVSPVGVHRVVHNMCIGRTGREDRSPGVWFVAFRAYHPRAHPLVRVSEFIRTYAFLCR